MVDGIKIEIVSPEHLVLSEEANSVSVPGTEGYFTVMGDHTPLMTTLKPGFITVTGADAAPKTLYVRGGFADVSSEGLTVLAEEAKSSADFKTSEIEAALKVATESLAAADSPEAKSEAQAEVDGWKNLLLEAAFVGVQGAH